jgi:hypothetical protein
MSERSDIDGEIVVTRDSIGVTRGSIVATRGSIGAMNI